jgi:hypothetical protein
MLLFFLNCGHFTFGLFQRKDMAALRQLKFAEAQILFVLQLADVGLRSAMSLSRWRHYLGGVSRPEQFLREPRAQPGFCFYWAVIERDSRHRGIVEFYCTPPIRGYVGFFDGRWESLHSL